MRTRELGYQRPARFLWTTEAPCVTGIVLAASCALNGPPPVLHTVKLFPNRPAYERVNECRQLFKFNSTIRRSVFGNFAMPFGSNRLRWICNMPCKWMLWLLMQIRDREGMHTICFREGESPTYVLRNECVVLNQVVTVCPTVVHLRTFFSGPCS